MILSIIVAAAENDVIGGNNQLLWRLPNDMKWFKSITTGHAVIMGRKTHESMGKALPNRRNIVISRNPEFQSEGCEVVAGLDEAIRLVSNDDEAFIIGGGEIYKQAWPLADKLYLTRVHTDKEGDTIIPAIHENQWIEEFRESHPADEKHAYAYTFIIYSRKQ